MPILPRLSVHHDSHGNLHNRNVFRTTALPTQNTCRVESTVFQKPQHNYAVCRSAPIHGQDPHTYDYAVNTAVSSDCRARGLLDFSRSHGFGMGVKIEQKIFLTIFLVSIFCPDLISIKTLTRLFFLGIPPLLSLVKNLLTILAM